MPKSIEQQIVTVIIPTMASIERAESLKKAVQSIRASSQNNISIIAVVNGNRVDSELFKWLSNQSDVTVERLIKPSLPNAILRGRELVQSKYFSTLDDDDEYLPGSTDKKLLALENSPTADVVIGNYYHCEAGVETLRYDRLADVAVDPFVSLMNFNWLHNNNALYRTSTIKIKYFQNYHNYGEWTWLAFQLMMDKMKIEVIDSPVSRCYGDTPNSLSKSNAYLLAYIPLFKRMLAASPPLEIRHLIARKMSSAYHCASEAAWADGQKLEAWRNHILSLVRNGGLRYITYTRHLLR